MSLFEFKYMSEALHQLVTVNMIVPQVDLVHEPPVDDDFEYPTLYLLHGYSDDQSAWLRNSRINCYAGERKLAVIMPSTERGWYTDTAYGYRFYTFIAEELPKVCQHYFRHLSTKRETTFIAGLSMGGYGALKIGLSKAERFAGVGAFSSAVDVYSRAKNASPDMIPYWRAIFGDPETIPGSQNDIYHLAEQSIEEGKPLPKMYISCGTEDPRLHESQKIAKHLEALGYPVSYFQGPGEHNWDFWDEQIRLALAYFFEN